MGASDSKDTTRKIEKKLSADRHLDHLTNKILLLGTGDSGKSTIFKQFISLHGRGFSEKDRQEYHIVVCGNIISNMKTLCEQSERLAQRGFQTRIDPKNRGVKEYVEQLKEDKIDSKVAAQIEALWADPGIQVTYEHRALYHLNDSISYYLAKITEIGREGYLPSVDDILRSRVRTTGIIEEDFVIDGNHFRMFDVGGQRNERKKWIHQFDGVTAVLFVAALSEYDQALYEDEATNRLIEALNLFDEICNSRHFKRHKEGDHQGTDTSMILFLNKRDLFAEKIQKVPLNKGCFPDYDGANTSEAASAFILSQFEARNRDSEKRIYSHITCATDKDKIKVVFNAVKDCVVRKSLQDGGLLS